MNDAPDKDYLKSELHRIYNNLLELLDSRLSKKEFDLFSAKLIEEIEKKVVTYI